MLAFGANAAARIQADRLATRAEEFVSENTDKVPADIKFELEQAVTEPRRAFKDDDVDAISAATEKISKAFIKAKRAVQAEG